jgi:hypothetical protein
MKYRYLRLNTPKEFDRGDWFDCRLEELGSSGWKLVAVSDGVAYMMYEEKEEHDGFME